MVGWSVLAGSRSYRTTGRPLRTERMKGGLRVLLRPLELSLPDGLLTVPAGFVTDYSSIPWFLAWVVNWSRVDLAGVAHDKLYATGMYDHRRCSRAYADRVWREVAMSGDHRANTIQGWGGWLVLRIFGGFVWYPYRWGWLKPQPPGAVQPDPTCCGAGQEVGASCAV